jgi:5-methylcytosine-specific restriction endonuclease McrA
MSRTIYEKINENYIKMKEVEINKSSFYNTKLQSYKLLLEIIDDKTDDDFNTFYIKYMSKFQLKQYYFTRLFNPYKECNFNLFDNTKDFIDKSFSVCGVNDENYYKELNIFLNDIVIINQKLKKEKEEMLELLKKKEKNMEVIKKEVVKEVKKTLSKQTKTVIKKNENEKDITHDNDKKKKKKPISATIKRLVWNTNIGEDIGKSKCMCCNSTDITQMSFNCGHIVAEVNGGDTIVSNLKPICQNCNSSMGIKNMEEFMKSLK